MNNLLSETSAYGVKHFILIAVCVILVLAFTFLFKKSTMKFWFKFLLVVGIVSETLKIGSYIMANEDLYGGYLPKTDLPFQLCSIQLIFIALLNFTNSEKLHRFLIAFMMPTCLIGGIAAILIPTSSSLNMPVVTVQYFLYHSAIIAFAIHIIISKDIQLNVSDYLNSLKFLAFIGLLAFYLNSMFYEVSNVTVVDGVKTVEYASRVNFMYVVDPPAKNLPILNKDHGWLVYIISYAIVAVTALTLCYIKPIIVAIKNKVNAKNIKE